MIGIMPFYAVAIGKKPGIYKTWAECKAQVHKCPGSKFKKFDTEEEAKAFVLAPAKAESLPEAVAYVDGSFYKGKGAYGVVLFHDGEETSLSGQVLDKSLNSMNNVGGEISGAQAAIEHCISHGIKSVEIVHDYQGVSSWANGDWKTNLPGTMAYKKFCADSREKVEIRFRKVKSHSGDKYNDKADMLAKRQLGL
jgi:ribonuclease HI